MTMNKQHICITKALLVLFTALVVTAANAQVAKDSDLFKTIEEKDRTLFELGFNQCDMQVVEEVFPEDFDFYHDKNGKTSSRDTFIKTLQEGVCRGGKNSIKRTLDESSMEVFALYDNGLLYGAIQTGNHHFGNTSARFTNLWLHKDAEWIPSVIMSYEHVVVEAPVISDVKFIEVSPEQMSLYVGNYEFSPDFVLSVVVIDGHLYGEAQGQKIEIRAYDTHRFLDEDQKTRLDFVVNNGGNVMGLKMAGANGNMQAKKLDL